MRVGAGIGKLASDAVLGAVVTAFLYAGTLTQLWRDGALRRTAAGCERAMSIYWVRNYIVGPATEELVFRSCMIATMLHYDGVD